MVDAVVSFTVQKLGDYLIKEANFLGGVRDEVEWLKTELKWMLRFIKDAEAKQGGDELISQWVSDIRDIAYDAEDVLDKYILDTALNKRKGISALIQKLNPYSKGKEQFFLNRIGKEIEALKRRIGDASRRSEMYGLRSIVSDSRTEADSHDLQVLKQLRRAPSYAFEENPVGVEDDTDILLAKLLDKEPRRLMISIYGMGGLGKTTLAKKLYHRSEVKNKFDCSAWVSVSQDYKARELLLGIIKSFNIINMAEGVLENKTIEDLDRCLFESLQGKSYLMVLDDVWRKEDWEILKTSFPDNKNGSRVIITTRIRGVAERSDENTYSHKLRFLTVEESWDLFCGKAFRSITREAGLDNLGREMVEKCKGLPLAIVVLGGLLSTKRPQEWRGVRDHIWRYLRDDSIHISYLLDLSFNNMSHQLKLCFLYLSIFPEDYEIEVEKLIRLVVAEGFAPQDGDRTMEEAAKDYVDQLINRSLIQVENRRGWRVLTCRVHDVLRDLAIQKAKELNFIHICEAPTPSSVISSCRRQVIYKMPPRFLWLQHSNSLSRSILCFNHEVNRQDLTPLSKGLLLLRVLDMDPYEFCALTEEIGKLIHLKYLGLHGELEYIRRRTVRDRIRRLIKRGSHRIFLPSSILNLQRLQTIDFSRSYARTWMELPVEINMMQELRHLIGRFEGTLHIENLTNLQTLKYVAPESWKNVNPDKLVNLRELRIVESLGRGGKEEVFNFESIAKLKNLRLLSVRRTHYLASLRPLSHCQCLIDLRLRGEGMETITLPKDMYMLLPNLECLSLEFESLKEDPMPALEMLPNLTILDLRIYDSNLKKLSCRSKGFPLLEILQLQVEEGIVEWEVEEGSLPMLRGLKTKGIPEEKIPERLRSIPPPAEWECDPDW